MHTCSPALMYRTFQLQERARKFREIPAFKKWLLLVPVASLLFRFAARRVLHGRSLLHVVLVTMWRLALLGNKSPCYICRHDCWHFCPTAATESVAEQWLLVVPVASFIIRFGTLRLLHDHSLLCLSLCEGWHFAVVSVFQKVCNCGVTHCTALAPRPLREVELNIGFLWYR